VVQAYNRNGAKPAMFLFFVRLLCRGAFAAGILFVVLALWSSAYFLNFQARSLVTAGTVTSVNQENDSDDYLYCPTVRFQAADGAAYTVPCRVWENRSFAVGDEVLIRYLKAAPNNAWPESQVRAFPRDFAIWGAFGLCLGFALRWLLGSAKSPSSARDMPRVH